MENSNSNSYLEELQKELKNYQTKEKKKNEGGSRKSREEILAKYFVPRNDQEVFRILPPKENETKPIQEAFFHVVSLNGAGGKKMHGKVVYCPRHNDPLVEQKDENGNVIKDQEGKPVKVPAPCPLCEKNKKILSTQDNSIKGIKKEELTEAQKEIFENNKKIFIEANKWDAKKFYIVRGIDKGKMKDGVKFWRFKKNYKNQGTFDRLIPVLNEFMEYYKFPYFDPENGSDLSISMTDAEFNGRSYKTISAIVCKPPSKLHEDPVVAQQWLNDPIGWRDVFKKKKAPNITPEEYLEMVTNGTDPYWDDSDSNNKKWVFPGRPDLEEKANQRDRDLTANGNDDKIEQASDIQTGVGINNVNEKNVGNFNNSGVPNAVDATSGLEKTETKKEDPKPEENKSTAEVKEETSGAVAQEKSEATVDSQEGSDDEPDDYDDLPF